MDKRVAFASAQRDVDVAKPQQTPIEPPTASELKIDIWLDMWTRFEGTAAQLQDEGLIPQEFEWPRENAEASWESRGCSFDLRRVRPKGHRGPRKSWLELDNWAVTVKPTDRGGYGTYPMRCLNRKAEDLKNEYRRLAAEGSAEWHAHWKSYWAALGDRKFQDFKALVPGLAPRRSGAAHG